jgi:hypothetical protein
MTKHYITYQEQDNTKWKGDPNKSVKGSGFSVPRGIEAIFSYNGLIMNDRSVFDKYRVMSIDGLADPDVRDNREDKPGEDGEDAYDSYYGGRTLVLQVRVEAYELKKLRDMEEALRTAFATMEEKPLYFLTELQNSNHYIMCKKSAALTKEENVESLNFRHFRDWQITLRASDPRFYRTFDNSISKFLNLNSKEFNTYGNFEFLESEITENYNLVEENCDVSLTSAWNGPSASGTSALKINFTDPESNFFSISKTFEEEDVYSGESYRFSGDVKYTRETSAGDPANQELGLNNLNFNLKIELLYLAAAGNILSKEVVNYTLESNKNFTFSISKICPLEAKKIEIKIEVISLYDTTSLYLDNLFLKNTNTFKELGYIEANNSGNYNSYPVIYLVGNISYPEIINSKGLEPFNNIKFSSGTSIPTSGFLKIDTKNRTVTDHLNNNKLSLLKPDSGWLKLSPGVNKISFSENTILSSGESEESSQILIQWKDAWI